MGRPTESKFTNQEKSTEAEIFTHPRALNGCAQTVTTDNVPARPMTALLCKRQLASHIRNDFAGALEIRALVCRRDNCAQPRLAFGNRWETDTGNVDARIVKPA